ncbi:MAG TPA: hypothetical protein VJS19_09055 [Candidatus Dormibacteraeota bacterium]|nr:hypothetical protein [Candidatus Dormibacteraeota bacterium]
MTKIVVAGLVAGALTAPAVLASTGDGADSAWLEGVRDATARFHSTEQAVRANYGPLLSCFDLPGVGGMGQHYIDTSRLDGSIDQNRPQALVYEVRPHGLKLVAVEWIIPWQFWVPSTAPRLQGHQFTSVTSLHLWALHAWIWKPNPLGTFANYNPRVPLCPGR